MSPDARLHVRTAMSSASTGPSATRNGTTMRLPRSFTKPLGPRRSKTRCEKKPESAKKSCMRKACSTPVTATSAGTADASATRYQGAMSGSQA